MIKKILAKSRILFGKRILCTTIGIMGIIMVLGLQCARKTPREKGIEYLEHGEYTKAVQSLTTALIEDSLNPEIYYHLSRVYAYMDSVQQAYHYYLKLDELGSTLKDDVRLKAMMAHFLNIEPYPSSIIPMAKKHQFRGTFSPDGEMIAVAAATQDFADIYLIKLDGTIVKRIISGGMNTDPEFSPTGERLVFVSNRDGDEELYLFDLDELTTEKLTNNTTEDFSPSFSPSGQDIIFVSYIDEGWEIHKMDLTSKKISRLTKNTYWDGFPKFSPDGEWIVFSSKRNSSEDIYIMTKDGKNEKVLYASPADDNDPLLCNNKLYFKSKQSGEWEIYQMDISSKSLVRLTYNDYPDWNPRISKDGSKLLVTRKISGRWRLYFINLAIPISSELLVTTIRTQHNELNP
jgi:Tol biopolymer transport system component